MLFLLALPILHLIATGQRYLATYAPSNQLIRRVTSSTPRWRTAMGLWTLAGTLTISVRGLSEALAAGAPCWFNLIVLILAWDALKIGLLALSVCCRACATAMRTPA